MMVIFDPSPLLQGIYDPRDPKVDQHLRILRAKEDGQRQRLRELERLADEHDWRGVELFWKLFDVRDQQELILRASDKLAIYLNTLMDAEGL